MLPVAACDVSWCACLCCRWPRREVGAFVTVEMLKLGRRVLTVRNTHPQHRTETLRRLATLLLMCVCVCLCLSTHLTLYIVSLSGPCSSASSWPGDPCLQHFLHYPEVCRRHADLGTGRQATCRAGATVGTHTHTELALQLSGHYHHFDFFVCSGTKETRTTACYSMMKSTHMNRWSTPCRKPLTAARKKLWASPPPWTETSVKPSLLFLTVSCYIQWGQNLLEHMSDLCFHFIFFFFQFVQICLNHSESLLSILTYSLYLLLWTQTS